ncbi:hypothetical protein BASA61_001926 [Batrachochytrium salamandrivorans]|nr:hypothetical protein BASA61_001926 [Batrachochytrium salamandrivorans]
MQFFYLLSFVVVASYAAALPQPAELSEQYSNNVDTTLASILKARSYQPVSNSQKDSATLVSLERRAVLRIYLPRSKNVGDGFAKLSENGEKRVKRYNFFYQSITPPAEFSKAVSAFISTFDESMSKADKKEAESNDFIVNILKDAGTVFQNVEAAIQSFVDALDILVKLFDVIKTLMSKSESGRIIYDDISNMMESLTKFTEEQQKLHEIIKNLEPPPSK